MQLLRLPQATARQKPQVNHDDVDLAFLHVQGHMQQPTLLQTVVGHVFVAMLQHGPATEQGVAMLAVFGDGDRKSTRLNSSH